MGELGQYAPWIFVMAPILIAYVVLASVLMGWPFVAGGLVFFLGIIFVLRGVGIIIGKIRSRALPFTDKRVAALSELLNYVQFVKMYTYEDYFAEKIRVLRLQEVKALSCLFVGWLLVFTSSSLFFFLSDPHKTLFRLSKFPNFSS